MKTNDVRYETVHCAKCGNAFALIDFRGNPHQWFCGGEPDHTDIARLVQDYPQVRFFT